MKWRYEITLMQFFFFFLDFRLFLGMEYMVSVVWVVYWHYETTLTPFFFYFLDFRLSLEVEYAVGVVGERVVE